MKVREGLTVWPRSQDALPGHWTVVRSTEVPCGRYWRVERAASGNGLWLKTEEVERWYTDERQPRLELW